MSLNLDGLAFDSLRVVVYDPAAQPAPVAVDRDVVPASLAFAPPAPNPVRERVRFDFSLPASGAVRLEVLDVQGRVRWARDGRLAAARYAWGWDLADAAGHRVAPGVYLARIVLAAPGRDGSTAAVRRFVVMP